MNVAYSLDDSALVEVPILTNTTKITLEAGNLNANDTIDVIFYIYNSMQSRQRWTGVTTAKGAGLVVTGLNLDATAKLTTTKVYPLRPKRCVFFGDSITEGVASQCHADVSCTAAGDLCNNAATKTWGTAVAAALDCEYSQVGFGGLGWTVSGGGAVVPFFTPGDPSKSSWNQIYDGAPRDFAKSGEQPIDYIFILHATNDGLREPTQDPAIVSASVTGWLNAQRPKVGPATEIFLTVPFGAFGSTQHPIGALKAGFEAYQKGTPDKHTHFLDLGPSASKGLTHFGQHSIEGCGGIHPKGGTRKTARHGELGAMLSVAAVRAMATAGVLRDEI
jgi:hypothetical protein